MKVLLSWLRDYIEVVQSAQDLAEILSNLGFPCEGIERLNNDAVIDVEVTSNRGDCLGLIGIARELATATGKELKIPGVELVEFDRHGVYSRCCGAGGAARKVFHENAIAMGRLTIDEAVAKGAEKLVLSCPACYAKVNEAMVGHERQVRIVDIMELLSSLVERGQP